MPSMTVKGVEVVFDETEPTGARGETVVLLHSSACSKGQWRALRDDLEARYRVVAPDLHGYGKTADWHGRRPLTLADEAEIVSALMAHSAAHSGAPLHLVGHSYGGAVALRFALERPRALRSLTLIEPVAFHLLRDRKLPQSALLRDIHDLAGAVAAEPAAGMARFVDFWNGRGAWAQMRQETRAELVRRAGKVAQNFRATLDEPVPPAAYGRIRVPTRILRGAASPPIARAIAARLAALLPMAELKTVPGAGHMLPLTHADAVNAAVAAQLDRTAEAAPLAA